VRFEIGPGVVALENFMGDDLSVVNAARVSFNKRSPVLEEKDAELINFLMKNHHASPFEHPTFQFYVKCPIFVAREWQRHRNGSFNELSQRYAKSTLEFYIPDAEDMRTQEGKPGNYHFVSIDNEDEAEWQRKAIIQAYDYAQAAYEHLLSRGLAKELARIVLPMGVYTQFFWTVNGRSLMNFISLRNSSHAQREIQKFAQAVEAIFARLMPITHKAFIANDRMAI